MRILAAPLGLLLNLIYGFVGNYGIAIIVFTVIVKCCMYPLYSKQIKSTARMADVQPKVIALQNKYKDDKETLNAKIMELYEQENYNPMSGCLPMIIQMPIIFGLFALLRNPILYMGSSTELLLAVHDSFLWIKDLSQPDLWVLPLAAGFSTFISFSQTQMQQAGTEAGNAPSMKIMKYIFPVMIVFMGRSFPAGLTIYWFMNTVIQIFFNLHLNKVKRKLREGGENKGKKKKIKQ